MRFSTIMLLAVAANVSIATSPLFTVGSTHADPDSIIMLPPESVGRPEWAEAAVLELDLSIAPRVASDRTLEIKVTVTNSGTTPFWIPDNLALPGGELAAIWNSEDGSQATRRLILGGGPRCGSNMVSDYVCLPASSYYGRQIGLLYKERPIFLDPADKRAFWPAGTYEFRVRMSLANGDSALGVPGGVFESATVRVTVTD